MENKEIEINEDDLREAMREMKAYLDITEEDLKRVFTLALKHARERLMRKISVGEIMTQRVVSVRKDTDIKEAARLLSENRISGMPVIDEDGKVIGIVSEADILASAGVKKEHRFVDTLKRLLGEPAPSGKRGEYVREIMTSPAITTSPDADIRDVARILDAKRIKRLPVVDEKGRLIGIISRADIIRVMR